MKKHQGHRHFKESTLCQKKMTLSNYQLCETREKTGNMERKDSQNFHSFKFQGKYPVRSANYS